MFKPTNAKTVAEYIATVPAEQKVQYRQARSNMLYSYCLGALKLFPSLKRIVGITTEPLPSPGTRSETSEDMVFVLQPNE